MDDHKLDFQKTIEQYAINHSHRPSEFCESIEQYTRAHVHGSQMLIGQLEASLIGFLLRIHGSKHVLEIGTYTGYSALAMAEQLPEDGTVTTLDIHEENVQLAKSFWKKSPHGNKITSFMGEGLRTLEKFSEEPETYHKKFDCIFIDADKKNYQKYFELSRPFLSDRGFYLFDNVLWGGDVLNPEGALHKGELRYKNAVSLREFNAWVNQLEGYYKTFLPIRDGLYCITCF
jgi:caffeoyl-CoA O-methyltransferase